MCIRRAKGKHENACFSLVEGSMFKLLCWRMPHVPKKLVMSQSNGSFWKKGKHERKTTIDTTLH
jgi:hypothetical protein